MYIYIYNVSCFSMVIHIFKMSQKQSSSSQIDKMQGG